MKNIKTLKGNTTAIVAGVVAIVVVIGVIFAMNRDNDDVKTSDNTKKSESMAKPEVKKEEAMMKKEEGVLVGGAMMVASKDIVDNAVNSKDHTTLVAAVKAAGLVETLKSKGPFTVFAPTNAAFAKLPAGTVETLLKPENKAKLTSILTYHVVPGAYRSSDIKDGMTLKTVNGEMLTFTMKDGKLLINGTSMVTIADVIDSNGVTYVVDTVLMPKM